MIMNIDYPDSQRLCNPTRINLGSIFTPQTEDFRDVSCRDDGMAMEAARSFLDISGCIIKAHYIDRSKGLYNYTHLLYIIVSTQNDTYCLLSILAKP